VSCNGKCWLIVLPSLFYCQFIYFMAIWYILWSYGIFYSHLVYLFCGHFGIFFPFWYFVPRRIWQLRFPAAAIRHSQVFKLILHLQWSIGTRMLGMSQVYIHTALSVWPGFNPTTSEFTTTMLAL
jgi:hypothetical protein